MIGSTEALPEFLGHLFPTLFQHVFVEAFVVSELGSQVVARCLILYLSKMDDNRCCPSSPNDSLGPVNSLRKMFGSSR